MILSKIASRLPSRVKRAISGPEIVTAPVYFVSTAATTAISAILLPVMVAYLSPADYGLLALFQSVLSTSNAITFFGMRAPLVRELTLNSRDEASRYVSSGLALVVMLTIALVAGVLLFHDDVQRIIHIPTYAVLAAILCGGMIAIFQVYLSIVQAERRAVTYAVSQLSVTIVSVGLTLGFLILAHAGWISRPIGYAVASTGAGLFALASIGWRRLFGAIKMKYIREYFALGIGMVPATLFLGYFDRFVLGARFTSADVGVYTLAFQISSAAGLIGTAAALTISPRAFGSMARHRTHAERLNFTGWLWFLSLAILVLVIAYGIAIYLLVPLLGHWKYAAMLDYFPWLLASFYFVALHQIFVLPLYHHKTARLLGACSITTAIAAAVLQLTLPDFFGIIGVAIALTIARALQLLLVVIAGLYLARANLPDIAPTAV